MAVLAKRQHATSGFEKLPTEIGLCIFELCLDPPPISVVDESELPLSYPFSPLLLGAVCRTWRDIAWHSPQLWTCVPVPLYNPLSSSLEGYNIVKEWFERSKSLPLFITVYKDFESDKPQLEHLLPLIRLINEQSSRWKMLDIFLPITLLVQFKQQLQNGDGAPLLESLRLDASDMLDAEEHAIIHMCDMAPKDMSIAAIRVKSVGVNWTNLTSLLACDLYSDEIVQIMIESPQLTHCALRKVRYRQESRITRPGIPTPHVHKSLTFLRFEPNWLGVEGCACDLFLDITLPSLNCMHFTWPFKISVEAPVIDILTRFLERSSPSLESLYLTVPWASSYEILDLLHYVPHLVKLTMCTHFSNSLWKGVIDHFGQTCDERDCTNSIYTSQSVLLPRLTHLTHYQPTYGEASPRDWDIILEILESNLRRRSSFLGNLASLGVMYDDMTPFDELERRFEKEHINLGRLANLVIEGVPLEICGFDENLDRWAMLDLVQLHQKASKSKEDINLCG